MGVRAVAETVHEEPQVTRLKLVEQPQAQPQRPDPEPPPARVAKPQPTTREAAELMAKIASILGFRMQLLLGFLATFVMTLFAAVSGSWSAVAMAVLFAGFVFLPLLYVAMKRG